MKKSLGILFMALLGMTSCTFEDEGEATGADRLQDVYIKFENAGTPGTRAEEVSKTATDKVTFSDGYIFFLTGQNNVKKCYHILPTGQTANAANNEIALADFWGGASSGGYLFSNVSGEVTKVYLIGNMAAAGIQDSDVRSKTTFAKLKELTAGIETQKTVNNVLIDGADDLQTATGGDATKKVADITLVPLCSRIEIAKFTAGGAVTAYKLQGIYVSHFYDKMAFNETSVAGNLQKYAAGGGANYTTFASLCDVTKAPATSLGTQSGLVTTPTTSTSVWAYQFFPGNNAGRVPPRIVIKLNGVSVNAGFGSFTSTNDYFLNIRGFKTNAGGVDTPMSLERGKVYKIANVAFKENDISDVPNPADIDLTVTVDVAAWVPSTVYPVM